MAALVAPGGATPHPGIDEIRRRATAHTPSNPAISKAALPGCGAGFIAEDVSDTLYASFLALTSGLECDASVGRARLAPKVSGMAASARTMSNAFCEATDRPAACAIGLTPTVRSRAPGARTAEWSIVGNFCPLPAHVPREMTGSHSQAGTDDDQSKVPSGTRRNNLSRLRTRC